MRQLTTIDITGNLDEIDLLMGYLHICEKYLKDLCEITFLKDFPQNDEYNPRRIIKYMLDKYVQSRSMITAQLDLSIEFKFIFHTRDAQTQQIIFSNHMQFRNDILMICYVHQFLYKPKYLNCSVFMIMMLLMVKKYDINLSNFNPYAITFANISFSYLSIPLELFYNNFFNRSNISSLLLHFNLPIMIYTPLIISILPALNDPPIAILLLISLVTYGTCQSQIALSIPLITFYQHILVLSSTKYPEDMKLFLCRRYNIVVLEGNEFKFAPCFAKYRQKAKDIISKLRPNDPNLKDILSII